MTLENNPLIDVLDKNGLRTGDVLPKQAVHQQGKLHRAVHLYLFNAEGNILLQRRADTVAYFPGQWGISLTGHVNAGEGSTQALLRELKEELGLSPEDITYEHLFSFRRKTSLGTPEAGNLNLTIEVFVGFCTMNEKDILFDPQEVGAIKFIPLQEFATMLQNPESVLGLLYGAVYADILYYFRNRLTPFSLALDVESS